MALGSMCVHMCYICTRAYVSGASFDVRAEHVGNRWAWKCSELELGFWKVSARTSSLLWVAFCVGFLFGCASGREGVQSIHTPQDLQPQTLGEAGVWFASGLSALVQPSVHSSISLSGLREVSAHRVASW